MKPMVSVILPTYNRAYILEKALQSVFEQTYKDYEAIVIDDGSTDATTEVVAKFGTKVRYFAQSNRGVGAARNRGLREARGKYVAFVDSDDQWLPEKLEKQIPVLEEKPNLGFVYAVAEVVDENGKSLGNKPAEAHPDTLTELLRMNFIPVLTVVARREYIQAVGGFDEGLSGYDDYHLWIRLAARYDFCGLGEKVATYRMSKNCLSANLIHMYEEQVRMFEKVLSDSALKPYRSLLKTRLAVGHYLLAKELYGKRLYRKATRHFMKAIYSQPRFGKYFAQNTDRSINRVAKQVKPYLAVAVSSLCAAFDFKELKH